MQKASVTQNTFQMGELSPRMLGRFDTQAYYQGAAEISNMVLLPTGGVTKRGGTKYIASTYANDKQSRLISYRFSANDIYMIELSDQVAILWNASEGDFKYKRATNKSDDIVSATQADPMVVTATAHGFDTSGGSLIFQGTGTDLDGQMFDFTALSGNTLSITDLDGTGYTLTTGTVHEVVPAITTPYSDSEIFQVKYVTTDEGVYFTHPAYPVQRLAPSPTFTTITETVEVQRTRNEGFPSSVSTLYGDRDDSNGVYAYAAKRADSLVQSTRIIYAQCDPILERMDSGYSYFSYLRIFTVELFDQARKEVSGSAWTWSVPSLVSGANGYAWDNTAGSNDHPSCVAAVDGRLAFGGSNKHPLRLWVSAAPNGAAKRYMNFNPDPGTPGNSAPTADGAILIDFPVANGGAIEWLETRDQLIVGQTFEEWSVRGQKGFLEGTLGGFIPQRLSRFGSDKIQAKSFENSVVFVQRGGRQVRDFVYSDEQRAFQSPGLTTMADHVMGDGIREWTYVYSPYPMLWFVKQDGVLACLTYDRENQVVGWHQHDTNGRFESAAVSPARGRDEVWLIVQRQIDGSSVRFIESMTSEIFRGYDYAFSDCHVRKTSGGAKNITGASKANPGVLTVTGHGLSTGDTVLVKGVFGMTELNNNTYTITVVDADSFSIGVDTTGFTTYVNGGFAVSQFSTVGGLDHLEGEVVTISADGMAHPTRTVSSGSVTLQSPASDVVVGLGYTSRLQTMPLSGPAVDGNPQKGRRRIVSVTIRFFDSLGVKVGPNEELFEKGDFVNKSFTYGAQLPLYTGDKKIQYPAGNTNIAQLTLFSDQPLPMTVLSVMPDITVMSLG